MEKLRANFFLITSVMISLVCTYFFIFVQVGYLFGGIQPNITNLVIIPNILIYLFGLFVIVVFSTVLVWFFISVYKITNDSIYDHSSYKKYRKKGLLRVYLLLSFGFALLIFSVYCFLILGILRYSHELSLMTYFNLLCVDTLVFLVFILVIHQSNLTKTIKRVSLTTLYSILISVLVSAVFKVILTYNPNFVETQTWSNLLKLSSLYIPIYLIIMFFCIIGFWIGIKFIQSKSPNQRIPTEIKYSTRKYDTKICIFIPAYNAAYTLPQLIKRIPSQIRDSINDIIIIDDSSPDNTYLLAQGIKYQGNISNMSIFRTITNQRYGGNQKLGYALALLRRYEIVVMLHGDAQYAPEFVPLLVDPIINKEADMVFGSRMSLDPLKGGMSPIKYIGNRVLTFIENKILKLNLSEFHSGFRAFSVQALTKVPFLECTNEFHFDTEIIIQMKLAGLKISEIPIPTYYGEEKSHVGKLKYGLDILKELIIYWLHDKKIIYSDKYSVNNYKFNEEELRKHVDEKLLKV